MRVQCQRHIVCVSWCCWTCLFMFACLCSSVMFHPDTNALAINNTMDCVSLTWPTSEFYNLTPNLTARSQEGGQGNIQYYHVANSPCTYNIVSLFLGEKILQ